MYPVCSQHIHTLAAELLTHSHTSLVHKCSIKPAKHRKIDSVLYATSDTYVAATLIPLQNRYDQSSAWILRGKTTYAGKAELPSTLRIPVGLSKKGYVRSRSILP